MVTSAKVREWQRLFDLDEGVIRENSSPQSFERGLDYYGRGSVVSVIRRGEELKAEVVGSEFAPYDVRVVFDAAAGLVEAWCSCPYDWGGWCKHIAATLLHAVHEPESVLELPTIDEVLSGLDQEELQSILLRLADQNPHLADAIEREASSLGSSLGTSSSQVFSSGSQPEASRVSVNVSSIRYRVHSVIRSLDRMQPSEAYWHVGGIVDEVRQVLDGAWEFIGIGDGRNALRVLEAITDEYTEAWEFLDDSDGCVGDFFYELGEAWTEAILSAELPRSERESWGEKLEAWCEELEIYAGGEAFYPALLAAEQGWDHPALTRILGSTGEDAESRAGPERAPGAVPEHGEHPDEDYDYDGELTTAQLNVLERQGRHEEYLRLAEHAGEVSRYAVMLVRLGRTEEAVEYGLKCLRAPEEALAVAEALCASEEFEESLRMGEHGLTLAGRKARLAVWVRDHASGMGRPKQALRAAVIAFREDPTLVSYLQVRELAGDGWTEQREELLNYLRRGESYYLSGSVEVFLHEGLTGDAIAAVEKRPGKALIGRVAEAAVESHPDWVIGTCRRQAEGIMDEGRSRYYSEAISWLTKVRAAYRAAGRENDWQRYLEGLVARHQRKYKLRPLLESLG